jgi:hypothetical protein
MAMPTQRPNGGEEAPRDAQENEGDGHAHILKLVRVEGAPCSVGTRADEVPEEAEDVEEEDAVRVEHHLQCEGAQGVTVEGGDERRGGRGGLVMATIVVWEVPVNVVVRDRVALWPVRLADPLVGTAARGQLRLALLQASLPRLEVRLPLCMAARLQGIGMRLRETATRGRPSGKWPRSSAPAADSRRESHRPIAEVRSRLRPE